MQELSIVNFETIETKKEEHQRMEKSLIDFSNRLAGHRFGRVVKLPAFPSLNDSAFPSISQQTEAKHGLISSQIHLHRINHVGHAISCSRYRQGASELTKRRSRSLFSRFLDLIHLDF